MKAIILIGILVLSVFLIGCSKTETTSITSTGVSANQKTSAQTTAPNAGLPMEAEVKIYDSGFRPQEVTIAKGGKVRWINFASKDHTITGRTFPMPTSTSPQTSTRLATGQSWEKVFDEEGFFPYTDMYDDNLQGKVIVK